jgi:hypothetical protein
MRGEAGRESLSLAKSLTVLSSFAAARAAKSRRVARRARRRSCHPWHLNDAFGHLNSSGGLGVRESRSLVVVRPVPQPPERFRVAAGLFHGGLATVAKAKHKVLMCPVCSGYGKIQIGKQAPGDVEGCVVSSADRSFASRLR